MTGGSINTDPEPTDLEGGAFCLDIGSVEKSLFPPWTFAPNCGPQSGQCFTILHAGGADLAADRQTECSNRETTFASLDLCSCDPGSGTSIRTGSEHRNLWIIFRNTPSGLKSWDWHLLELIAADE
jgi:hypothetical protein